MLNDVLMGTDALERTLADWISMDAGFQAYVIDWYFSFRYACQPVLFHGNIFLGNGENHVGAEVQISIVAG